MQVVLKKGIKNVTLSRKRNSHYLTAMNPALTYITNAPAPFCAMMMHLHAIILKAFPDAQLTYKWRLPFFYLDEKTMFCFLNHRGRFVDLGMPYGSQLPYNEFLIAGENRKTLRSLRFYKLEDINDTLVLQTLQDLYVVRCASLI